MSDSQPISNPESLQKDIFERLLNGETILSDDSQMYRLREEAFAVKKLLIQMNNSSNPDEIAKLLSQILDKEIQDVAVFTPIYINYGKHIKCLHQFRLYLSCIRRNYD